MLPAGFKPSLAINIDKVTKQPKVRYCSEKCDGIRVIFFGGVAYSRSLKENPNKIIQKLAKDHAEILEGCDGEIIAGDKYAIDVLQRSNSFAMKADKVDDFKVYLFDKYLPNTPWIKRYLSIATKEFPANVEVLPHYFVVDPEQTIFDEDAELPRVTLDKFEASILALGGEGVMVRSAFAEYKFGRSGKIEPELQKVKRFDEDEFIVVGYEQFESNQNEAKVNELGNTSRSTSKEGKVLQDKLGSLILVTNDGITFNSGSGFTEQQRNALWETKDELIGKYAKIQFFGYSKDSVPLLPVFKDFRSEIDM